MFGFVFIYEYVLDSCSIYVNLILRVLKCPTGVQIETFSGPTICHHNQTWVSSFNMAHIPTNTDICKATIRTYEEEIRIRMQRIREDGERGQAHHLFRKLLQWHPCNRTKVDVENILSLETVQDLEEYKGHLLDERVGNALAGIAQKTEVEELYAIYQNDGCDRLMEHLENQYQ